MDMVAEEDFEEEVHTRGGRRGRGALTDVTFSVFVHPAPAAGETVCLSGSIAELQNPLPMQPNQTGDRKLWHVTVQINAASIVPPPAQHSSLISGYTVQNNATGATIRQEEGSRPGETGELKQLYYHKSTFEAPEGAQDEGFKLFINDEIFQLQSGLITVRDFHRRMAALAASGFNKKRALLDETLEELINHWGMDTPAPAQVVLAVAAAMGTMKRNTQGVTMYGFESFEHDNSFSSVMGSKEKEKEKEDPPSLMVCRWIVMHCPSRADVEEEQRGEREWGRESSSMATTAGVRLAAETLYKEEQTFDWLKLLNFLPEHSLPQPVNASRCSTDEARKLTESFFRSVKHVFDDFQRSKVEFDSNPPADAKDRQKAEQEMQTRMELFLRGLCTFCPSVECMKQLVLTLRETWEPLVEVMIPMISNRFRSIYFGKDVKERLQEMIPEIPQRFSRMHCPSRADVEDTVCQPKAFADTCLRAADIIPERIKDLTEAKADINFADGRQRTALHDHAMALNLETVKSLVHHKASVDKEDSEGNTPFALAQKAGACEELMKALDYVTLLMLSGQTLAVPKLLFLEKQDFVSFVRDYLQHYYIKERHRRVSCFAIQIALDGHEVAKKNKSWEALGSPTERHVTLGHNSHNDPEKSKDFLRSAEQIGSETDLVIQGHLENFQDPDVSDDRGETAAWKAARNDDVSKLKILDMACAQFDKQDESGATPLFIASHYGNNKAVEFLVQHKAEVDLSLKTKASPLYIACQNGHKDTAAFLLMSGAEPDKQTEDYATSTFIAAQMGHFEIVKMLLEAKADKNMANVMDASPLFIAAQNDHKEIVEYLLEKQACIDQRTESGASPTYIAAQKGCLQPLQLLLDARADANLQANDGATSVLIAAQKGKKDAVQLLLKYGACIRTGMDSGATPLFVAAQNGYLEVVKVLVQADDLEGSDQKLVNICSYTRKSPFYAAAQNGHLPVVKWLHEKKADMNLKSSENASALFIAAHNGHLDVCLFILEQERQRLREKQECQLTERTEDGFGPLLVTALKGHLEIVKALTEELRKHFSPERVLELINEAKKGGATALYLASQNGHPDVVSYLIGSRASVHKALDTEETPMFIASQGGHDAVAQILLKAQADVNKGKKDKTPPLHIASQNGHTSLVTLLLDANASVNAQNDSMATALFISSTQGYAEIVSALLSKKADTELAIGSGARPLHVAAMKGLLEVAGKLLKHGADANKTLLDGTTTPHSIAKENNHVEVADLLLEAMWKQGGCEPKD